MPALANPRHEAFANNRAQGQAQFDAYVNAGFEGNPSAASQLAARPEVRARIQELYGEKQAARRARDAESDDSTQDIDRTWIMRQLKENIAEAQKTGQISAANKAVELLMDLAGLTKKSKAAPDGDKDEPHAPSRHAGDEQMTAVLDKLDMLTAADSRAAYAQEDAEDGATEEDGDE